MKLTWFTKSFLWLNTCTFNTIWNHEGNECSKSVAEFCIDYVEYFNCSLVTCTIYRTVCFLNWSTRNWYVRWIILFLCIWSIWVMWGIKEKLSPVLWGHHSYQALVRDSSYSDIKAARSEFFFSAMSAFSTDVLKLFLKYTIFKNKPIVSKRQIMITCARTKSNHPIPKVWIVKHHLLPMSLQYAHQIHCDNTSLEYLT